MDNVCYHMVVAIVVGKFEQTLDPKSRIRIPAKIRDAFGGEKLVMSMAGGKKILLQTLATVEELFEKADDLSVTDKDYDLGLTLWAESMRELEEDSQGRFVIPKEFREHADITTGVVFIGRGKKVFMYAKAIWEAIKAGAVFADEFGKMREGGI